MNSIDLELIMAASTENNLPEVRRLLSLGADVNAKDKYGFTSRLYTRPENLDKCKLSKSVFDHGADVDAKGNRPVSALCPL
jgi:hypothetical protein